MLVGASATGIGDLRSTPFGGIDYPGVEIHANVIDNILNRHFLVRGANQVAVDLLRDFSVRRAARIVAGARAAAVDAVRLAAARAVRLRRVVSRSCTDGG